MSFDPFGNPTDLGSAGPPPATPPSGAPAPEGGGTAWERVQIPAIFLIAVGVLNGLVGLFLAFRLVQVAFTPAEQLHEEFSKGVDALGQVLPAWKEALGQEMENRTPEEVKRQTVAQFAALTLFVVLPALFVIGGGVRMMRLRSFGVCVLASIVAATPCVSPCGTCCLGNLVGLWALFVLLSAEVRAGFR